MNNKELKKLERARKVLSKFFNKTKVQGVGVGLLEPNFNSMMVIPRTDWAFEVVKPFLTQEQSVKKLTDFFENAKVINEPTVSNCYQQDLLLFALKLMSVNTNKHDGITLTTSKQWVLEVKNEDWKIILAPMINCD